MTNVISGPRCTGSWRSELLQWSLVNKLRELTDLNGSPEFEMTWKQQDMPSGPPIYRLQASARPKGDSVFSGALASWPTVARRDYRFSNSASYKARGGGPKGEQLNNLVGELARRGAQSSTPSQTVVSVGLNPDFASWLMLGTLRTEWDASKPTATPSTRKSRRGSSKRLL